MHVCGGRRRPGEGGGLQGRSRLRTSARSARWSRCHCHPEAIEMRLHKRTRCEGSAAHRSWNGWCARRNVCKVELRKGAVAVACCEAGACVTCRTEADGPGECTCCARVHRCAGQRHRQQQGKAKAAENKWPFWNGTGPRRAQLMLHAPQMEDAGIGVAGMVPILVHMWLVSTRTDTQRTSLPESKVNDH